MRADVVCLRFVYIRKQEKQSLSQPGGKSLAKLYKWRVVLFSWGEQTPNHTINQGVKSTTQHHLIKILNSPHQKTPLIPSLKINWTIGRRNFVVEQGGRLQRYLMITQWRATKLSDKRTSHNGSVNFQRWYYLQCRPLLYCAPFQLAWQ